MANDIITQTNDVEALFQLPATFAEFLPVPILPSTTYDADYEVVRVARLTMLQKQQFIIDALMILAVQGQQPDAFEALEKHFKTYHAGSSAVLDDAANKEKFTGKAKPTTVSGDVTDNSTTNQIVFHGTPAELAKMLEVQRNKNS